MLLREKSVSLLATLLVSIFTLAHAGSATAQDGLKVELIPIGITPSPTANNFFAPYLAADGSIYGFGGGEVHFVVRQSVVGPEPRSIGQLNFQLEASWTSGLDETVYESLSPSLEPFFPDGLPFASRTSDVEFYSDSFRLSDNNVGPAGYGACRNSEDPFSPGPLPETDIVSLIPNSASWVENGNPIVGQAIVTSGPIVFESGCISGGPSPVSLDLTSKFVAQLEADLTLPPSGFGVQTLGQPSQAISVDLAAQHQGTIRIGLNLEHGAGMPEFGTLSPIVDPDLKALGDFNFMFTADVAYADQFEYFTQAVEFFNPDNGQYEPAGDAPDISAFAVSIVRPSDLVALCDMNGDGECNLTDMAALYAVAGAASAFDLDGSGVVGEGDILPWLSAASSSFNPAKPNSNSVFRVGDTNLDGSIDSTDLGILLNQFGATTGPGWMGGDLNMDNTVDSTDLGVLLNGFGSSSSSVIAVPEPQAFHGLLFAFLFMVGVAHRQRKMWQ